MKLLNRFGLACIAMAAIMFSCDNTEEGIAPVTDETEVTDKGIIPGKYIVVFKDEVMPAGRLSEPVFTDRNEKIKYASSRHEETVRRINGILKENGIADEKVTNRYSAVITGFAASLSAKEVEALQRDPRVAYVEPDRVVTLDHTVEAVYTAQEMEALNKGGDNAAQSTTCAISNAGGSATGSASAFIWIVDTGIDLDHPDLNVVASFGVAYVDSSPDDGNGHGTHVAGIAAARNNTIGVVGVSAGAPVVPVDVFGSSGSTTTTIIIQGMDYVALNDLAGDVVNMSLGPRFRTGCSSASAYRSALDRLNDQSAVVLAAGNSNDDASFYDPACQNLPNVYTVASMQCNRVFSSFSNWRPNPVDFIATGGSVLSTFPGGGYATLSGTSMAAPVVAGIIHARGGAAPRPCGTVTDSRGLVYTIACR